MHPASPSTLFSPIFSLAREKIGPPEASGSCKFVTAIPQALRASSLYTREPLDCAARSVAKMGDNLSGAARQLPWKGSLFRCGGAKKTEIVLAFLRGMCYNNNENHY